MSSSALEATGLPPKRARPVAASPSRRAKPKAAARLVALLMALRLGVGACGGDPSPAADAGPDQAAARDVAPDAPTAQDMASDQPADMEQVPSRVRVATFNASMWRMNKDALPQELADDMSQHARSVTRILQHVRPDVVLINEFDSDPMQLALTRFIQNYLQQDQGPELKALELRSAWAPGTNTGLPSGLDLNNDGVLGATPGTDAWANDAFGFGRFPGQYGMLILTRFYVKMDQVRTFQTFLWRDMPEHLIPTDFYSEQQLQVLRLSSKNHVDLPVIIGDKTLHLLASHPTPPAFDGPEQRNQRRNHDEIRFWVDYIDPARSAYIYDDQGQRGGLPAGARFVIVGDLNADPEDGSGRKEAIRALLESPLVADPKPTSQGAIAAAARDGRANTQHKGPAAQDTADFSDGVVGNLRVDYALPSANMTLLDAGVFWPRPGEPLAQDAAVSDHHLVWVDLSWR